MSVWQCTPSAAPLCGSEGELVAVSITVNPRDLEALLEALAEVDFPINPQIFHPDGSASEAGAIVEFPAYAGGLAQVRDALARAGFDASAIRVTGMLEEIQLPSRSHRDSGYSRDNPDDWKQRPPGNKVK